VIAADVGESKVLGKWDDFEMQHLEYVEVPYLLHRSFIPIRECGSTASNLAGWVLTMTRARRPLRV
jgi:hypothetical protein